MSRFSGGGSYSHHIQHFASWGFFRISWTVDKYVSGSRLRFPATYRRDTDRAGAERFAKKWGVEMPEEPAP